FPLHLRQWRQLYPKIANLPLLMHAEMPLDSTEQTTEKSFSLEDLSTASIELHLRTNIAQVLQMHLSNIGRYQPLTSLGIDSLMAMELRNRLENSLGLTLPGTLIWKYSTLAMLTDLVMSKLQPVSAPPESSSAPSLLMKTEHATTLSEEAIAQLS